MEERHAALVDIATEHGPCSVRHIFYRAVVNGVAGITKDRRGYNKVQRAVLDLRRNRQIPYRLIVDNTRWRRQATVWNGPDDVLNHVAATYRRDLWDQSDYRVEVWCESDSIAGTISSVTEKWAVPLFVCRGQSSETFAHSAVDEWATDLKKRPVVLYIGDHDPAGLEIEDSLMEKLERFHLNAITSDIASKISMASMLDLYEHVTGNSQKPDYEYDGPKYPDIEMYRLAVTWDQVIDGDLPGTKPKKQYPYPLAVEAEAMPPQELVQLLDHAIEEYVDHHQLQVLKAAEKSEREVFLKLVGSVA